MSVPDLHALPVGSVIAVPRTILVARLADAFDHWHLANATPYPHTTGDLLAMSQDWVVLRYGNDDDLDGHYDQARAIVHPTDLDAP